MANSDPILPALVNHDDDEEHERIFQEYFIPALRSGENAATYDHEYERRAREGYDYMFRTLLKTYTFRQLTTPLSKQPPHPTIPKPKPPPPPPPPLFRYSEKITPPFSKKPRIQDHPTIPEPKVQVPLPPPPRVWYSPTCIYLSAGESSLEDEKPPIQDHPTLPK